MQRWFLMVLLVSLFTGNTLAQTKDAEDLEFVKGTLRVPGNFSASFVERQLGRLGDSVAIHLLKLVATGEFDLEGNPEKALSIIERSFQSPQDIRAPQDRNPGVSLFILSSMRGIEAHENLAERRKVLTDKLRLLISKIEEKPRH